MRKSLLGAFGIAACAALAGCVMIQGGATYWRTMPVAYNALAVCVYEKHPWAGNPPRFDPGTGKAKAVIEQDVPGKAATRLVFTPVATGGSKVEIDAVMFASRLEAIFVPTLDACVTGLPAAAQTPPS